MVTNEFFTKGKGPDALSFEGHLVKGKIIGPIHLLDTVLFDRHKNTYRKVTKITGDERAGRTVYF